MSNAKLFEQLNTFIPVRRLGAALWQAFSEPAGWLGDYHAVLFKDVPQVNLFQDTDEHGRKAFFFYLPNQGSLVLFERYTNEEGKTNNYVMHATGLLRKLLGTDAGEILEEHRAGLLKLLQTFSTLGGKNQRQLTAAGFTVNRIKELVMNAFDTKESAAQEEPIKKPMVGEQVPHSQRETEPLKKDEKVRQSLIMVDPNDGKEFTQINGEIFWEDLVANPIFAKLKIAHSPRRDVLYLPLTEEMFQGQGAGSDLEFFVKFVVQEMSWHGWSYQLVQGPDSFDINMIYDDGTDGWRDTDEKSVSILGLIRIVTVTRVRDETLRAHLKECSVLGISNRRGMFFEEGNSWEESKGNLTLADVERFFTERAGLTPQ